MEQTEQVIQPARPSDRSADNLLSLVAWGLALLVIGGIAYLGWTVYEGRTQAQLSAPAQRVVSELESQIRANPNNADYRVRLGEAFASAGVMPQAIQQLNSALKIQPKHTGALNDLGLIAMAQGNYGAAQGYFQQVLKLTEGEDPSLGDPTRENAFFNTGVIALKQRQYDTAIGNFKESLRLNRTASDTYFYLAMAFKGLNQPDAELEQLQNALLFDPTYAQANYELGMYYLARKDYVDAANHLKASVTAAPKAQPAVDALNSIGTSQDWMAKSKAAQASHDTSAEVNAAKVAFILAPDNKATAVYLANLLEKNGYALDALPVWQAILKLAPNDATAKAEVARLTALKARSVKKSAKKR